VKSGSASVVGVRAHKEESFKICMLDSAANSWYLDIDQEFTGPGLLAIGDGDDVATSGRPASVACPLS
jgi:hypothetical protein